MDQAISNQTINEQLILHTDQGTQYTSKSYQNRLTELDIRHFFSWFRQILTSFQIVYVT
ncbi:hypothetical protein FC89_GL000864 [Liquorilactobacillus ghanensis DSM 18630]|uniref:Integrase catalytic domain-containing protein n=1 Tax=Liquorilactobacillus ghanensis DSM 18630 TaxID=1423750 RepID=A0A0R1VJI0_9LACO|nr:hypothetical protein FC89_GL000864 [Liquorilactobacillus ghanensis DSM 18630]